MTTSNEFRGRAVAWRWIGGQLTANVDYATDETVEELRAEIAARQREIADAAAVATVPPHHAKIRAATDAPTKRWGQCEICGDPMDHFRGGACMLCIAAVRKIVAGGEAR